MAGSQKHHVERVGKNERTIIKLSISEAQKSEPVGKSTELTAIESKRDVRCSLKLRNGSAWALARFLRREILSLRVPVLALTKGRCTPFSSLWAKVRC